MKSSPARYLNASTAKEKELLEIGRKNEKAKGVNASGVMTASEWSNNQKEKKSYDSFADWSNEQVGLTEEKQRMREAEDECKRQAYLAQTSKQGGSNIPFDQYDPYGLHLVVSTRQLAAYAKAEGYNGVKIPTPPLRSG